MDPSIPLRPVPPSTPQCRTNQTIAVDGDVVLSADLYVPQGQPPFPAILQITPYGAQSLVKLGDIYAARGYLFVAVDARGRYRSGGEWQPLEHDQEDGHQVVRWLSGHTLCNGAIGMRGHGYCAYTQLITAIDSPVQLRAMVLSAAPGVPFEGMPFQSGVFDIDNLFWLLNMTGRLSNDSIYNEDFGIGRMGIDTSELVENPFTEPRAEPDEADTELAKARNQGREKQDQLIRTSIDTALSSRPFNNIDIRFGIRQETFRQWLGHWKLDDYWQKRSIGPQLAHITIPTLHISGLWDRNSGGAIGYYERMQANADSASRQRLILGPWQPNMKAPNCDALPAEEAVLVERGAQHDELNDELSWFDQHIMDIKPGPSTQAPVQLFVTGQYRWQHFESWPIAHTRFIEYFLTRTETDDIGRLLPAANHNAQSESTYVFDPAKPTPYAAASAPTEPAPFDNSGLERTRDDILLFDIQTRRTPMALVGSPTVTLFARADTTDFDLAVKLLDVYPDEQAIFLTDGVVRARFGRSSEHPQVAVPGKIDCYHIKMRPIVHVIRSGHRLRLEIASSAFRRFDVNACTGGSLADETQMRCATITISHSAVYPSAVRLPVNQTPELSEGL